MPMFEEVKYDPNQPTQDELDEAAHELEKKVDPKALLLSRVNCYAESIFDDVEADVKTLGIHVTP